MPITSIKRDWGIAPSMVRIMTTDSIATVKTTGYLTAQEPITTELNSGVFGFVVGDTVLVSAADASEVFNFAGDDFATLVPSPGAGETLPPLPFIVGSPGAYPTIQSAINAASLVATAITPAIVLINAGTYPEDLTLKSYVSIAVFGGGTPNTVYIVGNAIYNSVASNGIFSGSGINFVTPSGGGAALNIAGSNSCVVSLINCEIDASFGTGILNTNANVTMDITSTDINVSAGFKSFDLTGGIFSLIAVTVISNDTPATITDALTFRAVGCFLQDSFIVSNSTIGISNSAVISQGTTSSFSLDATSVLIFVSSTNLCNAASGFWATGTGAIASTAISILLSTATLIDPSLNEVSQPTLVGDLLFGDGSIHLNPTAIQQSAYNKSDDSGVIDAYVGVFLPAISGYTNGMLVMLTSTLNSNDGASTLDIGLGGVTIITPQGDSLSGGEIISGNNYFFLLDINSGWVLLNSSLTPAPGPTSTQIQQSAFNHGTDIGVADAYVVNLTPAVAAFSYPDGLLVTFTPTNTNITTAPTLALNAMAPANIVLSNGAVAAGDLATNMLAVCYYSFAASAFILLTPKVT